ncbi:MAG: PEP-CTERM sorting domain-containing protein, partial [Saprospiraceae bacterium]|nr:PEP-CTERM sorting domain-containing protein [Saprospiraceae bacterium]
LTFGISNLDLDVWGGTSIYQETFISSVPHETLLTSVPIPALLPPAVPEPETYAMLLAGLGLVGYTVSRRKRTL